MSAERMSVDPSDAEHVEDIVLRAVAHELRLPVDAFVAEVLAGDASSRSYVRVRHEDRSIIGVRYPKPFSLGDASTVRLERWCRDNADDGILTFANDPVCHIELTALLTRAEVPVPEILAVDDREGVILLEDVGDGLVQTWMATASSADVIAAFERAVDLIACFRAATEAAVEAGCAGSRLALDGDKLFWELEFFRTNTFERGLVAQVEPSLDADVQRDSRLLADALSDRPRVFCHRDFHARNLIVRPGAAPTDGLVVIDFQDARMGPMAYDLVSLVEDPYVQLENWLRQRLVARFRELAFADGSWPGDAEFGEQYDLMTVQRMLKAVGTFTNQAAVRGKRDYLPFIAPAIDSAARALERLGRYPALVEVAGRLQAARFETE
jgi:aminoglycoside/choline kinase family phosphotransferase